MAKNDTIIDIPICIICGKPLPEGRTKYCSDECLREGDRQQKRMNYHKEKEKENLDSKSNLEKLGMITISVEAYTELLRKIIREERQATEEEIFNKTIQVIDSRFIEQKQEIITFKTEISKQIERIKQIHALETSIQSDSTDERLLKETNPQQFKRIQGLLNEEKDLTGEKNYEDFCNDFGLRKHFEVKAKDGDQAEKWAKDRVIKAKQNTHHSIKNWMTPNYPRRESL